ncbi:MAG: hypothetical protein IJ829_00865, partial [Kiritimatiellae bacterium]|nr:hypothetical protein [Kiritimatiellia bacterium]
ATVTVASLGVGATSATVRLEASLTADFATAVASEAAAATANTPQTLTVAGLSSGTEYYLRAVVVNNWGREAVVSLGTATTEAAPPTAPVFLVW